MPRWKKKDSEVSAQALEMREWVKTEKGLAYKKRHNEYVKEWRKKNKKRFHESQKRNYDKMRIEMLTHYSKGTPKCKCCGETGLVFLSLDHIKGNGSEERRKIDPRGKIGGNGFAYWLKKNNWPKGYQVLCYNCNFAKRQNKKCPHQTGKTHKTINQNAIQCI
jgi:hypothetical protein